MIEKNCSSANEIHCYRNKWNEVINWQCRLTVCELRYIPRLSCILFHLYVLFYLLFTYIRPTSRLYFAAFSQHLIKHVMWLCDNRPHTLIIISDMILVKWYFFGGSAAPSRSCVNDPMPHMHLWNHLTVSFHHPYFKQFPSHFCSFHLRQFIIFYLHHFQHPSFLLSSTTGWKHNPHFQQILPTGDCWYLT